MSYPYQFYAVVIPGLEALAARELTALSAHEIRPDEGGVHFAGTLETLYRVNLRTRLITRVLLRLDTFRAMSWPELYNKSKRLPWGTFLKPESVVAVQASCHRSRLMHSGRAAAVVGDALVAKAGCLLADDSHPPSQHIHVRFAQDECTISIDCTGERLDRRGYRLNPGAAPVRETIASGLLQWLGWQPNEPLLVPMCGSGTFAIEAALMAGRVSPGLEHDFPFKYWPSFHQRRWHKVAERAAAMTGTSPVDIAASDIAPDVVEMARQNAQRAGVIDDIRFQVEDVFGLQYPDGPGVMVCNPPYGQRIGRASALDFYRRLGDLLRGAPAGWRIGVLVPDKQSESVMGLSPLRRLRLRHGGQWLDFLEFRSG